MALIDELRQRYPDTLAGKTDAEIVGTVSQAFGHSPNYTAARLGLENPKAFVQSTGAGSDTVIDLKKGAAAIPGAAAGVADLLVGDVLGRLLSPAIEAGRRATAPETTSAGGIIDRGAAALERGTLFTDLVDTVSKELGGDEWSDRQDIRYSPQRQEAQREVDAAFDQNLGSGLAALATQPRVLGGQVVQSLPAMVAGGVAGRAVASGLSAIPRVAASRVAPALPYIGAGAGEGAVSAGMAFDRSIEQGADPDRARLAALGTGAVVGAIGGAGGALARRLGLEDIQVAMAGGRRPGGALSRIDPRQPRIVGGAVAEGVIQEAPQSAFEQAAANYALERPLSEGVGRAAIEGGLAGSVIGGAVNIPGGRVSTPRPPRITEKANSDLFDVADAPATEAPATEAPTTEAPVTEAPVTEAPVTDPADIVDAELNTMRAQGYVPINPIAERGLKLPVKTDPVFQTVAAIEGVSPQHVVTKQGTATKAARQALRRYRLQSPKTLRKTYVDTLNSAKATAPMHAALIEAVAKEKGIDITRTADPEPINAVPTEDQAPTPTAAPAPAAAAEPAAAPVETIPAAPAQELVPATAAAPTQELVPAAAAAPTQELVPAAAAAPSPVVVDRTLDTMSLDPQALADLFSPKTQGAIDRATGNHPKAVRDQKAARLREALAEFTLQQYGVNDTEGAKVKGQKGGSYQAFADRLKREGLIAQTRNKKDSVTLQWVEQRVKEIHSTLRDNPDLRQAWEDDVFARQQVDAENATDAEMIDLETGDAGLVSNYDAPIEDQQAALALGFDAEAAQIGEASNEGDLGLEGGTVVATKESANAWGDGFDTLRDDQKATWTDMLKWFNSQRQTKKNPKGLSDEEYTRRVEELRQHVANLPDLAAVVPAGQMSQSEKQVARSDFNKDLIKARTSVAKDRWGRFSRVIPNIPQWSALSAEEQDVFTAAIVAAEEEVSSPEQREATYRTILQELNKNYGQHAGTTDRAAVQGVSRVDAGNETERAAPSPGEGQVGRDGAETSEYYPDQPVAPKSVADVAVKTKRRRTIQQGQDAAVAKNPTTREAFTRVFKRLTGLDKSWRLDLYDTADDAAATPMGQEGVDAGAYGWVTEDSNGVKRAAFILDRVEAGTEMGKLLHEIGAHIGLESILTETQYNNLYDRIVEWVADSQAGNDSLEAQIASAAVRRLANAGLLEGNADPAVAKTEAIAYFVEEAVRAGVDPTAVKPNGKLGQWFRTLWGAFKAALRKLRIVNIKDLTAQHVVDLAYGAARLEMNDPLAQGDQSYMGTGEKLQLGIDMPRYVADAKDRLAIEAKSGWENLVNKKLTGWLTIDQLAERFGKDLPALKKLATSYGQMEAQAKEWVTRAEDISRDWSQLSQAQDTLLSETMRAATRASYDPADNKRQAVSAEEHAVNRLWNRLTPEARAIYKRVRDHYTNDLKEAKAYLASLQGRTPTAREEQLGKVIDSLIHRSNAPYFPLKRLGGWYTVARSPQLQALEDAKKTRDLTAAEEKQYDRMRKSRDHFIVSGHPRQGTADVHVEMLKKQHPTWTVYSNQVTYRGEANRGGSTAPALEQFKKLLAEAGMTGTTANDLAERYEALLIHALPENDPTKLLLKRDGVYGEDENMQAVFASSTLERAHTLSRLVHVRDIQEQMAELREATAGGNKQASALYEEMARRQEMAYSLGETPSVVRALTSLSYMAHLGASPAFWMINLTQIPMITMPWLSARNGNKVAQTFTELTKASIDVAKAIKWTWNGGEGMADIDWVKLGLTAQERNMVVALTEAGLIDFTIGYDLAAVAEGKHNKLDKLIRTLNAPTHATELINRGATGLTAYRIAKRQGKSHEAAIEFAKAAVGTTQINYSQANAARHMQQIGKGATGRALARLVFQFWRYQQGMAYLVLSSAKDAVSSVPSEERSQARATLAGLSAMLTATSGVFGLPFVSAGLSATSTLATAVATALGYDEDERDIDLERDLKNWMHDISPGMEDVLSKGLLSVFTGADFSSRIGQGDLLNPFGYARIEPGARGEDVFKEGLFSVAGAWLSNAATMYDGMAALVEGDYQKFSEKAIPLKFWRDISKGYGISENGLLTYRGEEIKGASEFSTLEKIWQTLGMAPLSKNLYYERNNAIQSRKAAVNNTRNKLIAEFAQARHAGKSTADIDQKIAEFNTRNPAVRITYSTKRQALQRRRDNRRNRDAQGVLDDKTTAPYLPAGRFGM